MEATSQSNKIRVLLVDDHAIVRKGLMALLEQEKDIEVCGEAGTLEEAFTAAFALHPSCLIVDLSIKDRNGLDLIRELRNRGYFGKILVLSMHDESLYADKAIRAGAQGYVMKDQADEVLVAALRAVLAGQIYASPAVTSSLLGQLSETPTPEKETPGISGLTTREAEVLYAIGEGMTTREIAEKFGLSGRTVDVHRVNIRRKLGCTSAAEVMIQAVAYKQGMDAAAPATAIPVPKTAGTGNIKATVMVPVEIRDGKKYKIKPTP